MPIWASSLCEFRQSPERFALRTGDRRRRLYTSVEAKLYVDGPGIWAMTARLWAWVRQSVPSGDTFLKRMPMLLAFIGLGTALFLVITSDAVAVLDAFTAVSWGLAVMVLVRIAILFVCGSAWFTTVRRLTPPRMFAFQLVRFVREAINVMLPVATIGGEIIGARLITFWGLTRSVAAASILVDILVQTTSQAIFAAMGALLLARVEGSEALLHVVLIGLGIATLGLAGFFLAQRLGGVHLAEKSVAFIVSRLKGNSTTGAHVLGIEAGLIRIWSDLPGVGLSFVQHLIAWLLGVLEIWIALTFMGHPTSLADALIIESLGQAVRGAAFPVPGGLGVQEGGFVILGHLVGIEPQAALALSFAKRVPDIMLGLPGLVCWQWLERRRARLGPNLDARAGD